MSNSVKLSLLFIALYVFVCTESKLYLDVRAKECDWECEIQEKHGEDEEGIARCCKNTGYEGPSECDDSGRAFCSVADPRGQGNKDRAKELENKLKIVEESLIQCKEDHKKYIESMEKTKAIIERMLSNRGKSAN